MNKHASIQESFDEHNDDSSINHLDRAHDEVQCRLVQLRECLLEVQEVLVLYLSLVERLGRRQTRAIPMGDKEQRG